jgi:hypothetical protein
MNKTEKIETVALSVWIVLGFIVPILLCVKVAS